MSNLQSTIENNVNAAAQQIAAALVPGIIEALRTSTLDQIVAFMTGAPMPSPKGNGTRAVKAAPAAKAAKTSNGRLARRSEEDIAETLKSVLKVLAQGPMGSEGIRAALGLDKKELPRVLEMGLNEKKLVKAGEKRATKYSLAGDAMNNARKPPKAEAAAAPKAEETKPAKTPGKGMPKKKKAGSKKKS